MITKKHYLAAFFTTVAIAVGLLPLLAHPQQIQATNSAQLSLSPSSQAVTVGSNVVVTVVEDSGTATVNGVQANLSYSTAQFNSVSISSTSAFNVDAQDTASGGVIQIARGTTTPLMGVQNVAVITLHASGTGTNSALSFTSGSAVAQGGTNILSGSTGGTYTVNAAPAPTPTPTPTPAPSTPAATTKPSSSSSSSSSSKSTTPASTPASTPSSSSSSSTTTAPAATAASAPTISNVQVSDVSDAGATVSWDTDQPSTSVVDYGLSTQYGLTAVADGLVTSHMVALTAPYITKGATYYIQVSSTNAAGATASGGAQQFTTAGFSVTMQVVDSNGKPIAGAEVTIGNQTETTNSAGDATFQNVPAGQHTVKIKSGGTSSTQSIAVGQHTSSGAYKPQTFLVKANRGVSWWPYVLVALIALLAAAFTLYPPTFGTLSKLGGYVRKLIGGKSGSAGEPSSGSELMTPPDQGSQSVSPPASPSTPEVLPGTFIAPPADPDPDVEAEAETPVESPVAPPVETAPAEETPEIEAPASETPVAEPPAEPASPTPTAPELPDVGAPPLPGAIFHPPAATDSDS